MGSIPMVYFVCSRRNAAFFVSFSGGKMYFISDPHFFHKKIREYNNRPVDWQERIIANWNKVISPNETIVCLGDFSVCNYQQFFEVRNKLNGYIFLIRGNHDRYSRRFYYRNGIYVIPNFSIDDIIFSHRPIFEFKEKINVHGHIHDKYSVNDGKHLCISVEMTGYKPITLEKIKSICKIGE